MKRLISIFLTALLLTALGCSTARKTEDAKLQKEPDAGYAQRVADAWTEKGFLSEMAPYSDEDLLDFYGIDTAACICAKGFFDATGYTTEAVVAAADEATAKEIESLLSEHLESVKASFRDYDPEALKIAEAAVLLREGGTVLLIVSPDAQAMLDVFRSVTP